jgi:hypothetical protein
MTLSVLRLYSIDERMINECKVVDRMRCGRRKLQYSRGNPTQYLCPPKIPHDLTWNQTQTGSW